MPFKDRRRRVSYQKRYRRVYQASVKGLLVVAYQYMRKRVSGRGHPLYKGLPICDREEFYTRFINDPEVMRLHERWIAYKGKKRKRIYLRPTPDRIEPSKGYEINNIRWRTYHENVTTAEGFERKKFRGSLANKTVVEFSHRDAQSSPHMDI